MRIYKAGAASVTLSGQTFTADADGIIDVPDHLVGNAFTQGFVSAKGRMRQLQQDAVEQIQGAVAKTQAPTVQQDAVADTAAKKKQS